VKTNPYFLTREESEKMETLEVEIHFGTEMDGY
jgi:hypothetical protein